MLLSPVQLLSSLAALSSIVSCAPSPNGLSVRHPPPLIFRGPNCYQPDTLNKISDCLGGCNCNARAQNPEVGICNSEEFCGPPCKKDIDCPKDWACAAGRYSMCPGGSTCVPFWICSGPDGNARDPELNYSLPENNWEHPIDP